MKNLKNILQAIVFAMFFSLLHPLANAGSYDDFFRAIELDDVSAVQALQLRGFDLNTPSPKLEPPLVQALAKDSFKVAAYLAGQGQVQVEAPNTADETPLMMAAIKGQLAIVERLIERKAQVNRPGWTPLHYAASHDGPQALAVTRLLLEHYAYIDAASPNGTTPLMMAARYGSEDVVRLLLAEGADPSLRNQRGQDAIDFARSVDRPAVVELIASAIRSTIPKGSW
jgi:hypothetical protein